MELCDPQVSTRTLFLLPPILIKVAYGSVLMADLSGRRVGNKFTFPYRINAQEVMAIANAMNANTIRCQSCGISVGSPLTIYPSGGGTCRIISKLPSKAEIARTFDLYIHVRQVQ